MLFTKGHGTGNDFVILPDPDGSIELTPELVAALCDRHRGIGADGVLRVVRSAKHPDAAGYAADAEWFMDYWNADGSCAEMCGNGVRVFTRYLITNDLATPSGDGLPIATRAGVVRAVVGSPTIAVHMNTPSVYGASTATVGALTVPGVSVNCGNPHLVCELHDGVTLESLDLLRPPAYDHGFYPSGVNIEFVVPGAPVEGADLHVHMRVHERGSAETLSCGSGAMAVGAVALRHAGLAAGVVAVDVPGGRLTVTRTGDGPLGGRSGLGGPLGSSSGLGGPLGSSSGLDGQWWLAGPAVLLATGEVDVAALV